VTALIERRPRRGTVVIAVPREKSPWAIRSVEDLIDRNLLEQPRVLSAKAVSASRFPDYATLFGIARRGQVFVIERVSRGEPGERAFYSVNAMRLEDGKALSRRDIGLEPLIVQIEKARRIRAYRVRQEIEGGQASLPAAQHLGIPPGHPTVVVRRTYLPGRARRSSRRTSTIASSCSGNRSICFVRMSAVDGSCILFEQLGRRCGRDRTTRSETLSRGRWHVVNCAARPGRRGHDPAGWR
jgi:hypothetical protein